MSTKGVMMILSPAKTLDLDSKISSVWLSKMTRPDCCTAKTQEIAAVVKKKSAAQLKSLLKVSDKIAATSKDYWNRFDLDGDETNERPAIFCFSGAAYRGLQAQDLSDEAISYLQDNLRIIDPLYGVLKPLDALQPYRLEMATKGVLQEHPRLALYWKSRVSSYITKELERREHPLLLNLASDEYAAAIDVPHTVKCIFHEEGRVVSVHAKRARGLMARFVGDNNVQDLPGVRSFNLEGYALVESKSDDTTLVFDRRKAAPKKAKKQH